jgi:hypothetical protein
MKSNDYRRPRCPLLLVLVPLFLSAIAFAAAGPKYCRVLEPSFTTREDKVVASVQLSCHSTPSADYIPYPAEGPVFVGATLYRLTHDLNESTVVRELDAASILDLPAAEISPVTDGARVVLEAPAAKGLTHYVVAVWDSKEDCPQHVDRPGCQAYGYVLGRIDIDEMVIPVDAFPRPRCDIEARRALPHFDCFGPDPSEFCTSSDCVNLQEGALTGLGYSIFRWRVAPLPSP